MSNKNLLAALSADNVREHVTYIVKNIPSRLSGTENGKRMAEYSAETLKSYGIDAQVQELNGLVSFPGKADIKIISPVEMTIPANTLGHSLLTDEEGISGELLYVASGAYSEYAGREATNKISFSELSYSPARHEKQRIASELGCTGAVMMNWGYPDNKAVPYGSVKPAWGNPTPHTHATEMPTLPCIGIARKVGLELKQLCEQGPVQVWFRTYVENAWKPVQITVAGIQAANNDDFVLLGGHQDSWFGEASTDNAAGNACMYELARVFNEHRGQLRRGLELGFWTGHETGTMVGSSWYVDQHWDRLRKHAVAYMQIDQPFCTGTTEWETHSNFELRKFHEKVEARIINNIPRKWRRLAKIGDSSLFGVGVPSMFGQGSFTEQEIHDSAHAVLGWWHHSDECTLDKLDFSATPHHLRVYASYLWELCTAPVLPLTFSEVAIQFKARLEELAPYAGSIGLQSAIAYADEFVDAAVRFDKTADDWRSRYESNAVENDDQANHLNNCMKKLSRILVPLQSTTVGTYGHDPYGHTPQSTMIPVLYDVIRLSKLKEDSEERYMLETQLIRDRNRVVDGLSDSTALVNETLKVLN